MELFSPDEQNQGKKAVVQVAGYIFSFRAICTNGGVEPMLIRGEFTAKENDSLSRSS